jgi:hypothetical protein
MIEIKGFWGMVVFLGMGLLALALVVTLPVGVIWITWNALVSEVAGGPMIAFWQAAILTVALGVALRIVFQPTLAIQVKRVQNSQEQD